ncbi:MAG: hypothetical protein Q7J10_06195 [Methanosarcinaceae archaeon]|nr:hypothetical protein [Methanosarcinaceae archaeon]
MLICALVLEYQHAYEYIGVQIPISKNDFGPLHNFKEGIIASKATLKIGGKYSIMQTYILLALI